MRYLTESCRSLVVLVKQDDHGGIPNLLDLVLDEVGHGADHGSASHIRVHLTEPSVHYGGDVLADVVDRNEKIISYVPLRDFLIVDHEEVRVRFL